MFIDSLFLEGRKKATDQNAVPFFFGLVVLSFVDFADFAYM